MTKFTKGQIQEVTNIILLANTPQSLLKALLKTPVVDGLRKNCSNEELLSYYKKITAKVKRTPVVGAMAYATLVALLVSSPTTSQYPDAGILQWGRVIESYINKKHGTTQTVIINPGPPRPTMRFVSATGSSLEFKNLDVVKHITRF